MTHTDKMNDITKLEKNLLDKTALDNRRWQLFLVNSTMGIMAFFGIGLTIKGPLIFVFSMLRWL